MNKRLVGYEKEELAAAYLETCEYQLIEKNFYSRYGEIDLICRKDGYLIFVEVKYRKDNEFGFPEDAITVKKMQSLWKTANYYLYKNKLPEDTPCRFDVVSILGEKISVIEHCMEG
ncbi:MAG: YraN family protein [Velocimicrobium sp.]